jgi:Fic family protein
MIGTQNINITPAICAKLCDIDEFKGFWAGLEAHTTGLNMLKEVAEFGDNFKKLYGPLKDRSLTPAIISLLHAAQIKQMGQTPYRTQELTLVISKDDEVVGAMESAAPDQIKSLTDKLVSWLNTTLENKESHPLLTIAIFTGVFLQISPYEEENLKIARFLVLVLMMKSGYSYVPFVPLERIINDKAEPFYRALKLHQEGLAAGNADWDGWLNCFLDILQAQKNILKDRLFEKEKVLSHLPTLSAKVLKLFEHHNRLQMKQIVKLTNGRRSTIKLRLGEMVDGGYLKRYGTARSTWYSLR